MFSNAPTWAKVLEALLVWFLSTILGGLLGVVIFLVVSNV